MKGKAQTRKELNILMKTKYDGCEQCVATKKYLEEQLVKVMK